MTGNLVAVRNRYLDLLRAAAIVRVIVYHLYGWPWLSVALPAMGVMFALAGSLTAASLAKRDAGQVITSRLRRLLPPLWLLGVLAVPVMLVVGWTAENDGAHPFSPARLLFWLVPLGDPPGSDKAVDVWEPLWYLRAYLWFVLLSPVLYALYRRIGWAAVALPLVLMGALQVTGLTLPETADAALWDFVTYGACWIAGFAHHDGRLARIRPWAIGALTVGCGAGAYYWLRDAGTWDLNDVSEAQALWSLAFVLLALRWQPPMGWLARARPLDRAVTMVNARAVTVYLWHNIAIAAVWPVLAVLALDDLADRLGPVSELVATLLLTLLAVVAFGWAEDLAAGRRLRLWPDTGREPRPTTAGSGPAPGPAHPADGPVGPVDERARPTEDPAHPADERARPTEDPTHPADEPSHPAGGPASRSARYPAQPDPDPAPRTVSAQARRIRPEAPAPERDMASAMAELGVFHRPGRETPQFPAAWPPIPRSQPAPAADDPGLPVAGRRAEPLPGQAAEPGGQGWNEEVPARPGTPDRGRGAASRREPHGE